MVNDFIKIKTVSPALEVGNPEYNVKEMLEHLKKSDADIIVFPELSITGSTCKDLFFQKELLTDTIKHLNFFLENNAFSGFVLVGLPYDLEGHLLNLALLIQGKEILGAIPKTNLGKDEYRWFSEASSLIENYDFIEMFNQIVPFGEMIFKNNLGKIMIEVNHSINQANRENADLVICLDSKIYEYGQADKLEAQVKSLSYANHQAYIYLSSGSNESSSDGVYQAMHYIYEDGRKVNHMNGFSLSSLSLESYIDLPKIQYLKRLKPIKTSYDYYVDIPEFKDTNVSYEPSLDQKPFVPKDKSAFQEIFYTQAYGLARRLKHIHSEKIVLGISGGIDSSLALLVAAQTMDELNLPRKNIHAYTLPGLHTSSKTKNNAIALMEALGVTSTSIDLKNHILDHLDLIDHDSKTEDITYENTQARLRTTILMNLANKLNALLVGTGDLSEAALGWSTYNGDQMSMYNPNAGVPKTTARFLLENYPGDKNLNRIIEDILLSPITPELKSNQTTESSIGKYEVNDFILYRYINCGDTKNRIKEIIIKVFKLTEAEATRYTNNFFKRFFSAQFKRQASPDGPKIFANGLKANSDFFMNADVKRQ